MSEIASEVQCGWCNSIDSRNLVKQIGQPHELGVIRYIHTPDGVIYQLITDGHLITDSLLAIMHDRSPDMEILIEGIIQIQSQ